MPSLTHEEMQAVASAQLISALEGFLPSAAPESAPPVYTLEFARRLVPSMGLLREGISLSADTRYLFYRGRHVYVFPMNAVRAIDVVRMRRAKGPGGAWLELSVSATNSGVSTKSLIVAEAPEPDGLNEVASKLADALGRPMKLQPYEYDC